MAKEWKLENAILQDFRRDQVILKSPYQVNAFAKELQYLKQYEPERLLAGFRENKGLTPKASKYPGWEDTEIRGHTLGHYLTACAQAYGQTKDEVLRQRMQEIVGELAVCQFEHGYVSAFPEVFFDRVEQRNPVWVPWYTMHKIIAGLVAVYQETRDEQALHVVSRLGDWVYLRASRWSPELQADVLAVEYGGMNDCMYDLYEITQDPNHLYAAHQFDEMPLFEAVHKGHNWLSGKHANTMIPKFVGAMKRFMVLGDSERFYLEAAVAFWELVVSHHSYITGGNSENEHFGEPDILDKRRSDVTCETCNSYNMLKLTRALYKYTGDRKYADFYERTYVNAILSSQNPETGMTTYFQPMATGYFKVYSSAFSHFWCCTGTGMESFTKLNDSIYYYTNDRLYVTQYVSSVLEWADQGVRLSVQADLPATDRVVAVIELPHQEQADVELLWRIPDWVVAPIEVEINGEAVTVQQDAPYLSLRRTWRHGDRIGIRLPMSIEVTRLPDNPNVVGFSYGPVVLSAALGTDEMTESRTGILVSVPVRNKRIRDFMILVDMSPETWIAGAAQHLERQGEDLAFRPRGTDAYDQLVFTPHYEQHQERYGIYWGIIGEHSEEMEQHIERTEREARLQAATIDSVQIGNDQYELQHAIHAQHTEAGTWEGMNGRLVQPNGWLQYELGVVPHVENLLEVTYLGVHSDRILTIQANGQSFVQERILSTDRRAFITKRYVIPAEIIGGRETVSFTFRPDDQRNGIYGMLRTMLAIEV